MLLISLKKASITKMKITKNQLRMIIKEACGDAAMAEPEIYGHGGKSSMAKSQLFQIATDAAQLHDLLNEEDELPEWVQSKIAVMADSMDAVFDHIEYKSFDHAAEELEVQGHVAPHAVTGREEFDFTGDVGDLPGEEAFGIGYEAGKRGLK